MIKARHIFNYLSEMSPYRRRRRSADWFLPASIGLGVGIAAGVGIGLLVAPSSGEHTRRRLRYGAQRAKERAVSATRKAAEELPVGGGAASGEASFEGELGEIR